MQWYNGDMDETTQKILEIVTDIQEELHAFRAENNEEHRAMRSEVVDLRHDIEELQENIGNMSGYAKEIVSLMARMTAVEKHVGISK